MPPTSPPSLCQRFHTAGIKVQAKVLGESWDNPTTWKQVIDAGVDWLQPMTRPGFCFSTPDGG